jgi:DNA adenine methylase
MSIKHPVLKYYGSKFRLAQWIISFFPAHRHYVEPFGGAANVLLVKEPSRLETYNDLNSQIVNFFRVLRNQPDELLQQIRLTPWARAEFENCLAEIETDNPIEAARRLFFRLWMSFQSAFLSARGNWRRANGGARSPIRDIRFENLVAASQRLQTVQIENRDAFRLIREMDSPDTLFYLDPPYVFSTRSTKKAYSHEMTNDRHREFADLLYGLKGFVVLSGYPSQIYEELFERRGWARFDKEAVVMGGGKKTECLWLSPRTAAALRARLVKNSG